MNDASATPNVTQERLLKALQDARHHLQQADRRLREPLAILGIGGQLPGADDPASLWPLLRDAGCAIAPISAARDALVGGAWSMAPEPARQAGFLNEIRAFDHRLFGISPAEAQAMDPQHRLLLQAAWSALEDACIDPGRLRHSATGVWIGISNSDYAQSTLRRDPTQADAYAITGSGLSLAAGRLSYLLGLRGPSMAIDTACSSSLVALHLAAQSLRSGETDLAVVGGVQLLLEPDVAIGLDRMGALSPSGRSRAFDAQADGFVRGEGALCVVLARASDPLSERIRPRAWMLGSAVNQDGPSTGLTAPNGRAQSDVIRAALDASRVDPQEVELIEAHGTGTPLGDPIELRALESVFAGRAQPLTVSSVKSNIGHLEACAGLAGVLKVLLCMEHGQLPAQAGLEQPTPHHDWSGGALTVPTQSQAWPASPQRRVAGVSSFGFSGTNAHVVLADSPLATPHQPPHQSSHASAVAAPTPWLVPVSARTPASADALAQDWATALSRPRMEAAALVRTAQRGRMRFEHRRALIVEPAAEPHHPASIKVVRPEHEGLGHRCIWLFTGQGSPYVGMGRTLHARLPLFARHFDAIAQNVAHVPLRQWLDEADETALRRTEVQQPLVVALSCALAAVWRDWGIKPAAVIGHSVGELAAAAAAGFLSPAHAVALAARRGQLMQALPQGGGMLALAATVEDTLDLIGAVGLDQRVSREDTARLTIAGFNGPRAQTVAGPLAALEALSARAQAAGVRARMLAVSHPFHSAWMKPIAEPWARALESVEWQAGEIALFSTANGRRLQESDVRRPPYWVQQALEPVRFEAAVRAAWADGAAHFLEVGPSGGLAALISGIVGEPVAAIGSLQAGRDEVGQMLQAAAVLHCQGVDLDWEPLMPGEGPLARGPGYRFEKALWWVHRTGGASPQSVGQTLAADGPPDAATGGNADSASTWRTWHVIEEPLRTDQIRMRLREIVAHVGGPEPSEPLDEDENFFSLGMDSITLVQAGGMISRTFGVKMDLGKFYDDASTVNRLAKWLSQAVDRQAAAQSTDTTAPAPAAAAVPTVSAPSAAGPSSGASATTAVLPNRPGRAVNADVAQRQRAYLESFAPRYVRATSGSRAHVAHHRPHLATGRNLAGFRADWKEIVYQIVGGEGRGSRLRDVDGREYIDFTMGFGVCLFGHAPAFVNEALQREIARGMPLGPLSDLAGQAAEQLTALTGTDRVAFFNTGSDAVMNALRIARTVRQRNRIVLFEGSYHGTFDGVLALQLQGRSLPIAPGTPGAMVEDVTVLRYGDAAALDQIEQLAPELAAVLVEPVQSRHPELQPQGFLRRLRALTTRVDVPLVLDEMITGFRCHPGGIQKRWGIEADLVTYGKILGGGTPIGAVAGRSRYMDAVDGGAWAYGDRSLPQASTTFTSGTFCNHPLGMAAAQAVLSELRLRGPAMQDELDRRTAEMCNRLNRAYEREGFPLRMVWFSSLFRFQFGSDLELLFPHLIERGYYVWEGRNCFISSAHTQAEIDGLIDAVMDSLRAMRRGGLIAEPTAPMPATSRRSATLILEAPASAAQARVLMSQELHSQAGAPGQADQEAQAAYVLADARVSPVPLDERRLRAAWKALVERHEALRTGLHRGSDQWLQRVEASAAAELEWVSLPECAAAAFLDAPPPTFDLAAPPLARLRVLTVLQPESARPDQQIVQIHAHHAVVDGLSFALLVQDLWALYAGERLVPVPGPVQHAQQDEADAKERLVAARDHWNAMFAAPLQIGSLPLDRPHGVEMRYAGGSLELTLEEQDVQALRGLARSQRVTLYAVLLTAWAALLTRLSQATECVVGVPASVRPLPHLAHSVGMFVATLPLRLQHDPRRAVADALQHTAQALLGAMQHAEHPIEEILQELRLPGRRGRHPLLDTMFEFEVQDDQEPQVDGQALRSVTLAPRHALFDLDVEAVLRHGSLHISARYRQEVYDESTVQAWMRAYTELLRGMVREPLGALGDLRVAPALPRAPQGALPQRLLLHEPVLQRLAAQPQSVVLRADGRPVTAVELDGLARAGAQQLRTRTVAPEQPIALLMQRSTIQIAGWLAALASGGCVVPLDPDQPLARQSALLQDLALTHPAGVLLLCDDEALATALAPHVQAVLTWSEQGLRAQVPQACPWTVNAARIDPEMLAYQLFTSGSTGKPKAVAVSHRAAACHVHWWVNRLGLTPQDAVLHKTVCTFDTAISEIFGSLWSGARLVLPGAQEHMDFAALADTIVREAVTVIEDVPSLVPLLLEQPGLQQAHHLRWYNPGGEALSAELAQRLRAITGARVLNLYGPTEAAVDALCQEWDGTQMQGRVPIGRPVDRVLARVLDAQMQPVVAGGCGELYLGGDQLARGYAGRADLTAERFVPDPHGEPGQRLYRTGDQVRQMPDGTLVYLGRGDSQIKIRGQRIELSEIQAVVQEHPAVEQAVVTAWPDEQMGWTLVAHVHPAVPTDLRAQLQSRLPRAWVPAAFVGVPTWPLLANGKLDRAALARPSAPPSPAATAQVQGLDPLTTLVLRAFEGVLGQGGLLPSDDFFALGGHSLTAVRVVAELRRELGIDLRVRTLFDHPQAHALVQHLSRTFPALGSFNEPPRRSSTTEEQGVAPAQPLKRAQGLCWPLSAAQRGVWLACQLSEEPAGYNMAQAYRVEGVITADSLRAALQAVQAAHPALRSRFIVEPPSVLQCVHETAEIPFMAWPTPSGQHPTQAQATALFEEAAQRPFDLENAPLIRVLHGPLQDGGTFVGFIIHHLVFDGWSVDVLVKSLSTSLAHQPLERPDPQAPPPAPRAPQTQEHRASREYWAARLSRHDERPEWFPERPRAAVRSLRGGSVAQNLPTSFHEDLRLATQRGLTLTQISAAASLLLVHLQTGSACPSMALVHAGRDDERTHDQIGLFVNTLVLSVPMQGDTLNAPSARAWLSRVRGFLLEAMDHATVAYADLVSELSPGRQPGRQPWFDLALNVLEGDIADAGLQQQPWAGLNVQRLDRPVVDAQFDLTVTLERGSSDHLQLSLEHASSFCTSQQAQALLARFATLLTLLTREVARDPLSKPMSLSQLLDHHEAGQAVTVARHRLTAQAPMGEHDLWERFEATVQRTPKALALRMSDGGTLAYDELHRQALAVADALQRKGIRAGDHCGLMMAHGPSFLAALLGILQRGAVYVPLDPQYPHSRLAEMATLADLKCLVVVNSVPDWWSLAALDAAAIRHEAVNPAAPPRRRMPLQSPAYLMFTSGSSGRPKGVWVPHEGVVRLVQDSRFALLSEGAAVGWASSLSFDASTLEIWAALTQGATLVEIPRALLLDPLSLQQFLSKNPLDLLWLTAGLFHATARIQPDAFGRVRRLMVGGDRIEPAAVSAVMRSSGAPAELFNGYGPTENTTFTTVWSVDASRPQDWVAGLPIGSAVAHTTVDVLDPTGRPTMFGLSGELATSGAGLALGYWKAPDLTAERFVPDPLGPPGSRRYMTGDRVCQRQEGPLDFLGRVDRQVKIRGHRIELGEVEQALLHLAGVEGACVLVHGQTAEDRRLVAFVVSTRADATVTLRTELAQRLPIHLLPSRIVALHAFPLNVNGKIDKARLLERLSGELEATHHPDPGATAAGRRASAVSLESDRTSDRESVLIQVWQRVLGRTSLGLDDNFFASGGDSIMAIQVAAALSASGWSMRAHEIFEAPTVRELAHRLHPRAPEAQTADDAGPLAAWPILGWFAERQLPGARHFCQAVALDVADLDASRWHEHLEKVVRRHAAFRLRLRGNELHLSDSNDGQALHFETAPHFDETDAVARLALRLNAESGPLMAAAWHPPQQAGQAGVLLLVAHHLAVDGVSWRLLATDLEALLDGRVLPPSPQGLRAWSSWSQERARELGRDSNERRHWMDVASVGGQIAADDPQAPNRAVDARRLNWTMDRSRSDRLGQALVERGWGWDVLALAAVARALRHEQPSGLRVDIESHGRSSQPQAPDLSAVVGWFTALYPVAVDRVETTAVSAWLEAAAQALKKVPGDGLGWGLLRQVLQDPPLSQVHPSAVLLNHLGDTDSPAGRLSHRWLDAGEGEQPQDPRSHEIEVSTELRRGALHVSWTAAVPRYGAQRLQRWMEEFARTAELAEEALRSQTRWTLSTEEEDLPIPE